MSRAAAALSLVMTASLGLVPGSASAQQGILESLNTIFDLNVSSVSTTITQGSGAVTTNTNSVFPRLTLNMDTLVYPSLRLNAGGVFDVNTSALSVNRVESNSTISRMTPFFELRSTNPSFSPGIGYFRRVNRASATGTPGVTLVNEDYAAYLGWKPEGLPQSDFQFIRTNTFDDRRAFEDTTKRYGSLVSRYNYKNLGTYYQGLYLSTTDRVTRLETRQLSHAARVDQSSAFIRRRLLWNATYNVNHQDFTTAATGEGGEVALPVSPFAGLAALSDTPVTAALSQNPPLIDGNLTASAGVNLGLPGLTQDAQARNIGLDFLNPARVSRILVWVDRELPIEVYTFFSWEIYSSPDNLIWTRQTAATTAPFGPFENRFEIDFPGITARYLKLVVRPLSAVLPEASRFPEIFVTELQAFDRRPADEARGRLERTNHLLNTDVRMRILDRPAVTYEGFYLYNRLGQEESIRETLSNGLSVNHTFGRILSVYGRGAREQGVQPEGRRVATLQNATVTITPIPAFRSSLLYTGQDERVGDILTDRSGLFLQNSAQVYRGIDLLFGFGWNVTTRETGETLHDRLVNFSGIIVPRQNLNVTFSYAGTSTKRSGTFTGSPRFQTRRGYVTVAFDPTRTLHLVVGEEVIAGLGEKTRTTHDIGANWAPFPDGTLQVIFAYNEALRSLEFGKERILRAGVRWNLSRRSYVDVTHQRITSEYLLQRIETRVLSADVKLFF